MGTHQGVVRPEHGRSGLLVAAEGAAQRQHTDLPVETVLQRHVGEPGTASPADSNETVPSPWFATARIASPLGRVTHASAPGREPTCSVPRPAPLVGIVRRHLVDGL